MRAELDELYRHWASGDLTPSFDFYAEDMEWGWSPEFPDIAGVYVDKETPNSRLRTWLDPWESFHITVEDYVRLGEDVIVALTRYRGRGKGSGVWLDTEGAHVWQFRDGKAVRLEVFASRTRALCVAANLVKDLVDELPLSA